ncbi:PEP-CTERM sorting domain-containing protein [Alteraurantiacibacter aestuarii]
MPEPGMLLLFGAGAGAVFMRRRRKKTGDQDRAQAA